MNTNDLADRLTRLERENRRLKRIGGVVLLGIVAVVVPMSVGGEPGVDTYFDLVDLWVERLRAAFSETES